MDTLYKILFVNPLFASFVTLRDIMTLRDRFGIAYLPNTYLKA